MRKCTKCNEDKELTEFYKHKVGQYPRADMYYVFCKKCACEISRMVKLRNYDATKEREKSIKRRETGKQKELSKKMAAKYPEKYKARRLFRYAVVSKKITRLPCAVCGEAKSEGHHEDYSKPLEVKWLCRKHHAEVHRKKPYLALIR